MCREAFACSERGTHVFFTFDPSVGSAVGELSGGPSGSSVSPSSLSSCVGTRERQSAGRRGWWAWMADAVGGGWRTLMVGRLGSAEQKGASGSSWPAVAPSNLLPDSHLREAPQM